MSTTFGRAAAGAGEFIEVLGLVFCLPLAILALGLPVALVVRVVLWAIDAL